MKDCNVKKYLSPKVNIKNEMENKGQGTKNKEQ